MNHTTSHRFLTFTLVLLLALAPCFVARAQVRPVYSRGAAGLGHLLQRLQTTASAMHTAAHPDDEDTALIARLARGDHARVTYLSLNRGEGGQNIIGAELFEPLGVIRTEELLQARKLDGGSQMFTRAFDYGFTKTRDEAARKWGERLILGDMVQAIRKFRPLVILSRFSGTPADGHGHHQLAGYLTPIAFRAAADPAEFPEQLAAGLRPWQAKKLYVGQSFRPNPSNTPTLRVETGVLDPLTGRTFFEVAMEGRSQHKSQEMGSLEVRGAQASGLRLAEDKTGREAGANDKGIFDGIDTSLKGIPELVGLKNGGIGDELSDMQQAAARALADYDAFNPRKIIPHLADGLRATRKARARLASGDADANPRADADFLLAGKEREFAEALQRAAGVETDALANTETVVPGDTALVTVRVFVPEGAPVKIGATRLLTPAGWQTRVAPDPQTPDQPFRARETATRTDYYNVSVPANAELTAPYWLDEPRAGDVFRWETDDPQNEPFAPPVLTSETTLEIVGVEVTAAKGVQYRYADDIRGEIRRELNVVPALSVAFDSNLLIAREKSSAQMQRLAVRVVNNSGRAASGQVRLRLPAGWTARPASQPFALDKSGARTAVFFDVMIPANARGENFRIAAEAAANNMTYNRTMHTVAYPHISTHRYYTDAVLSARVFDLDVADVRVGYIMGSGDEVPDSTLR